MALDKQSIEKQKENAARAGAECVRAGMLAGLGSGSTSAKAVEMLGRKRAAGDLDFRAVCTSEDTEALARQHGIPTETLSLARRLDVYLDGADQIDPQGRMIKGGGGALLREKLVALNARRRVIMVDSTKTVAKLGGAFPLPVDVVSFTAEFTLEIIRANISAEARLRLDAKGGVYANSDGHCIVDCPFPDGIDDPESTAEVLRAIPGVVDVGLFFGLCDDLVIGGDDGVEWRRFEDRMEVPE